MARYINGYADNKYSVRLPNKRGASNKLSEAEMADQEGSLIMAYWTDQLDAKGMVFDQDQVDQLMHKHNFPYDLPSYYKSIRLLAQSMLKKPQSARSQSLRSSQPQVEHKLPPAPAADFIDLTDDPQPAPPVPVAVPIMPMLPPNFAGNVTYINIIAQPGSTVHYHAK